MVTRAIKTGKWAIDGGVHNGETGHDARDRIGSLDVWITTVVYRIGKW